MKKKKGIRRLAIILPFLVFLSLPFHSLIMVRPLNVTVPKLVPSQRHYANTLKLLIAAEAAGIKINQLPGDNLTVVLDDVTILDPNVAVR